MPYRYPPEFRRKVLDLLGCWQVGGVPVCRSWRVGPDNL